MLIARGIGLVEVISRRRLCCFLSKLQKKSYLIYFSFSKLERLLFRSPDKVFPYTYIVAQKRGYVAAPGSGPLVQTTLTGFGRTARNPGGASQPTTSRPSPSISVCAVSLVDAYLYPCTKSPLSLGIYSRERESTVSFRCKKLSTTKPKILL